MLIAACLLAGCGNNSPAPTPSHSGVSIDLREPGKATQAVHELVEAADNPDVVRVRVTTEWASLTYRSKFSRASTLIWHQGEISFQDEGTDSVASSSFALSEFNFNDVGAMFEQAAKISGSDTNQELQINEYSAGQALMTVTTNPESSTVFFRPDGTLIAPVDYSTAEGIHEALTESTPNTPLVLAVGISSEQLWVDVAAGPKVIERRTRSKTMPAYYSQRNQAHETKEFDPGLINAQAITDTVAKLTAGSSAKPGEDSDQKLDVVIQQSIDEEQPLMHFNFDGKEYVTDLAGNLQDK